jgi:hypothetical protein
MRARNGRSWLSMSHASTRGKDTARGGGARRLQRQAPGGPNLTTFAPPSAPATLMASAPRPLQVSELPPLP